MADNISVSLIPRLNSGKCVRTPWAVGHPKSCRDLDRGHRYRDHQRLAYHCPSTTPEHENAVWSKIWKNIFAHFWAMTFSFHPPLDIRTPFGRKSGKIFSQFIAITFSSPYTHPWTSKWRLVGKLQKFFVFCNGAFRGDDLGWSFLKLFYRLIFRKNCPKGGFKKRLYLTVTLMVFLHHCCGSKLFR